MKYYRIKTFEALQTEGFECRKEELTLWFGPDLAPTGYIATNFLGTVVSDRLLKQQGDLFVSCELLCRGTFFIEETWEV